MFPQKQGLGVQLTHGLRGPAVYVPQFDEEQPWLFARDRVNNEKRVVRSSTRTLIEPQLPISKDAGSGNEKPRLYKARGADDPYVSVIPNSVLKEIGNEDQNAIEKHPQVYDPSYGSLMDIQTLRRPQNKETVKFIAVVSGETKTVVRVYTLIQPLNEIVKLPNDERGTVKPYDLGPWGYLEFHTEVKQIEVLPCPEKFVAGHLWTTMAVRTSTRVYWVHIKFKEKKVKLKVETEFDFGAMFGEEIGHIETCPEDQEKCLMIGTKGRWCVTMRSPKLTIWRKGHIDDPWDHSKFKRCSWTEVPGRIILMSRSYLKLVDLEEGLTTDVITTNTLDWSELREYKRLATDDEQGGFLLTSKELILCDTSVDFKRVLAWKHNLDPRDPTLRMTHKNLGDSQLIIVYSHAHPFKLVFEFQFIDGFPTVKDPYLLELEHDYEVENMILLDCSRVVPDDDEELIDESDMEDDERDEEDVEDTALARVTVRELSGTWTCLFQLTKRLELKRSLLGADDAEMINKEEVQRKAKSDITLQETTELETSFKARELITRLFEKKELNIPIAPLDNPQIFQDYATKLVIQKGQIPKNLKELGGEVGEFDDFEEFGSMLAQLHEHCENVGVDHFGFDFLAKFLSLAPRSLTELFISQYEIWENEEAAKEAIKDIAHSCSVTYDQEMEEAKINENKELLPGKMKKLVDDWDNDYPDSDDEADYFSVSQANSDIEQPSQPMIKLTQQSQQPTQSSQSMMKPASQRFTSQVSSQINSQTKKKKKKKVKGFA